MWRRLAVAALAVAGLGWQGQSARGDSGLQAYNQVDEWSLGAAPSRVVHAPSGDLYLLTPDRVERRSPQGVVAGSVQVSGFQELAVDSSASLYGVVNRRRVVKLSSAGNLAWSSDIPGYYIRFDLERPPFTTALEWDAGSNLLAVAYDAGAPDGGSAFVLRNFAMGGSPTSGLTVHNRADTYWDMALGGGRTYLLNRTRSSVEVYQAGSLVTTVAMAEPAERIAVGPDGSLFALARRQWIYKYTASGGLAAAWDALDPAPDPGSESRVTDLAVDTGGRVYVTDPARRSVRVYALDDDPGAVAPPPPAPPSLACSMLPDKWAEPTQLRLGEHTQVTLRLGGSCPEVAERADVVLVVDRSGSMEGSNIVAARNAVQTFVSMMNLSRDQVALVAFESTAQLMVGLTTNGAQVSAAAGTLTAYGGTDIAAGIDLALAELTGPRRRADAKPIIVLMTDGKPYNSTGAATLAAADRARFLEQPAACRIHGTCRATLYSIGLGDVDHGLLPIVATSPDLYFYAPTGAQLEDVYRNVARRIAASVLLKSVTILDLIPANMRYIPGSATHQGVYDANAHSLTWTFAPVPFSGISMSYWLEPLAVGEWPTNISATYDGPDGLDQPQRGPFPVPRVIVVTDTPTPTASHTPAPTATATWTPTASPTVTPSPTTPPSPTTTSTPSATPAPTDTPVPADTPVPPTTTVTASPTPTASPSPTLWSSATPTGTTEPPTATPPTPSPTPTLYKIYLPIEFHAFCFKRYADTVFVIDASTTMLRKDAAGRLKIDLARAAVRLFLDHLTMEPDRHGRNDQAAIAWFNDTAEVASPLTASRIALDTALVSIVPVEGSRIDLGLIEGTRALFDEGRRVDNRPVLVLLTDGIPNRTTFEAVFEAADAAKRLGARIYTVGYGLDVEAWALERIASEPGMYYYAPNDDELARIYDEIAGQVICR